MNKPLKVFITYARTDKEAKDKLIKSLAVMKRSGLIDIWHDTEMLGGDRWQQEIFSKHLPTSDLLLYLISIESLASENCYKEFEIAKKKKIKVIPIIFSDCDWENDQLSDLQSFPDNFKPINEWTPESKGWKNVVAGIRKTVEQMLSHSEHASDASMRKEEAEVVFQHGNFLLKLGKMDMAIETYSEAIRLNPRHASAYNNRGVAYNSKREHGRAIEDYAKAIECNPELANAYNNRGNVHRGSGEHDCAIEDYTKAIECNPELAGAYNDRGAAYAENGEFDCAIEDCNRAIELAPELACAYNNRGAAYDGKGEHDLAIKNYTMAIKHQPDHASAYNNRGAAYADKGELNSAIVNFTKAIELDPDYAKAYRNRGIMWLYLQRWENFISDLSAARDVDIDIAIGFRNIFGSVANFERITGIRLPTDLAAMLTQQLKETPESL